MDDAVGEDLAGRSHGCQVEIGDVEDLVAAVVGADEFAAWHEAPIRVAHHDAKGVNLVNRPNGRTTVLDLDTVMGGTILSDVGELIRTCTRPVAEGASFEIDLAEAAVRGFVNGWEMALTASEVAALPLAGVLMTLQNAVRFLTDHLGGDTYFRVRTLGENLHRARVMAVHARNQLDVVDDFRARLMALPIAIEG